MQQTSLNPIRALREARGLSVDELARLAGMSHSSVLAVEQGRVVALTPSWAGAIEAMGGDFPRLCEAYRTWRVAEQVSIAARLEPQA
jgi:transcriptional regulator with XRE-family HTH domain